MRDEAATCQRSCVRVRPVDGTVTHIHDLGAIVVVQLQTDTGHAAIVILADHMAARAAARRWTPGRHLTATGTAPPGTPNGAIPILRAHRIRSHRSAPANQPGIPLADFLTHHGADHLLTPHAPPPTPEVPRA